MTTLPLFRESTWESLEDAKAKVAAALDEGITCPCCQQFAKRYRRKIHAGIARELIRLYQLGKAMDWVHVRQLDSGGGDLAKCLYWRLVEERGKTDDTGAKTSGYWRIADAGRAFVERRMSIEKYALVYDGALEGFTGPKVDIVACLGSRFSYAELMDGV
jgi:hypothetical protein